MLDEVLGRNWFRERRRRVGGRTIRVGSPRERARMEPVSVATPTYRIPGVRDSSGALKLFIRPIIITEPFQSRQPIS